MAMLVLNDVFARTWQERVDLLWPAPDAEFWPAATRRVPMIYLAEVYWDREFQMQQQGFDFTYDKRLLDRLHHGHSHDVRGHLRADSAYAAKLAHFVENHDEPRSVSQFGPRVRAAAALTFTLPGLRFFFDGQLEGAPQRAPVQLGRWADVPERPDIQDFYARLLKAIDQPLFHAGEWSLIETTNSDLIAYAWRSGQDLAIAAANISRHEAEGLVQVVDLPKGAIFEVKDQLSDQADRRTREELSKGLHIRLASGDAYLFRIEAVPSA
jgi:hypothetical protein